MIHHNWGKVNSKLPCLEVSKMPMCIDHELGSIQYMTKEIGCTQAFVSIKSLSGMLSHKNTYL